MVKLKRSHRVVGNTEVVSYVLRLTVTTETTTLQYLCFHSQKKNNGELSNEVIHILEPISLISYKDYTFIKFIFQIKEMGYKSQKKGLGEIFCGEIAQAVQGLPRAL